MQARWLSGFLDRLGAVLGTAAPLFGQSKRILEKPGDKGWISLDPALLSPPNPGCASLYGSSSLCTGACSPAGAGWVISSCGCKELARGTKRKKNNNNKKKNPTPFSIVLGEQEPLAPNFGTSFRHPDGALPNPAAPLLFLWLRLGCAEGRFPHCGPAAKGLLSPLKGSQRNVNRE